LTFYHVYIPLRIATEFRMAIAVKAKKEDYYDHQSKS